MIDAEVLRNAATRLKVLAHPVRLRIIEVLQHGEKSVAEIQEAIGQPQAITSQHLTLLKDRGILTSHRDMNRVFYTIHDARTIKIVHCIQGKSKE